MNEILDIDVTHPAQASELCARLGAARTFLAGRLDEESPVASRVSWSPGDAPPESVAESADVGRDELVSQSELLRGALVGLRWASSAGYAEIVGFDLLAHHPRRGAPSNHIVARRRGGLLRVEVSPYSGETLVRSEIERLLRRLDVPRTTADTPWPSARLCVVVPEAIAEAILAKSRPRRCAYWVLAHTEHHTLFEVLPVSEAASIGDLDSAGLPAPFLSDPDVVDLLTSLGAEVAVRAHIPHIRWPGPGDDAEVARVLVNTGGFRSSEPEDWRDALGWESYWRFRAIAPGVGRYLFGTSDAVMLRYLMRQKRANIRDRSARVLVVGSGLSLLPQALAAAGFGVTVLELSATAIACASTIEPSDADLARLFELACDELDVSSHQEFLRPDGSVVWIEGDLFDPSVCRGPYDLIVLTRTLDGLSDFDIRVAVPRLDPRLAPNGWCWVVVQNSGFKWLTVQRAFGALEYAVIPYDDLPVSGKAMTGGLTAG